MALAYTAPTWTDGSGEGLSASNLQAISNCIEGLVQGSDKAIHSISISNGVMTVTYADGTVESNIPADMKGISSIAKTGTSGLIDTYTITYTDGTTTTFTVTNGAAGTSPTITMTATADATSSVTPTVTVTKTGSDDAPNFALAFSGLKGAKGDKGNTGSAGADGVSPEVTIATITGGHSVTITDKDHPSGQSFNVMDGQDASNDWSDITNKPNFATVATSGSYNDLSNKPNIDEWTSAVTASTSGSDVVAVFDNLSNSYGYLPYFEDELIGIKDVVKTTGTQSGTIKLTYKLKGATSGTTQCYLRIMK